MTKITSPVEGLNHETYVGDLKLVFKDGVAEVDDLSDAHRSYLLGAGFKVGTQTADPAVSLDGSDLIDPADLDSRDLVSPEVVGTPLRDAAVDPQPGDFLTPTNAGEADPHGPEVVSPEIHASQGTRPVKGGDVHVDDTDKQDELEKEHAAAATDGTPITPLPSEKADTTDASELKGAALDEALEAANLPKTGTADEKRARLAEYQGTQA